jgi:hypothetical protein
MVASGPLRRAMSGEREHRESHRVRLAAALTAGLVVLICVARMCAAVNREATHITPPPQPPLAIITEDNFDDLRAAFNAGADRPRVLVMLSPT